MPILPKRNKRSDGMKEKTDELMKRIDEAEKDDVIWPTDEIPKEEPLEQVGIRVERSKWFDFTAQVKKDRKKVWEVLETMINKYLEEGVKK
jgi:hypothetical protein